MAEADTRYGVCVVEFLSLVLQVGAETCRNESHVLNGDLGKYDSRDAKQTDANEGLTMRK